MDPLTLALIFAGSAAINFLSATSQGLKAGLYQGRAESAMKRNRMDMRQAIDIQKIEFGRLGSLIYGSGWSSPYGKSTSPTSNNSTSYNKQNVMNEVGERAKTDISSTLSQVLPWLNK